MLDIPNQEDDHYGRHQDRIENVEEYLVRNQVPSVALQVFDDSENASDQDDGAGRIQNPEVSPPRYSLAKRGSRRLPRQPNVEHNRGDDEESEDADLREETRDDDLLPNIV